MKIGLFFGSFNPMHIGHLVIANYMARCTDLDRVWIVVSPHNPLKSKSILADARKRLAAVKKAIGRSAKIKVSDVEFSLPQPSYTVDTLGHLKKKYPKNEFVIIIGSDNLKQFPKWKDHRRILKNYQIYVYPRNGVKSLSGFRTVKSLKNIKLIDAPCVDVSSTYIREQQKMGKDVRYLLA